MNSDIIRTFLSNALMDEVESFTENYIRMISEDALKSKIFRQYILLFVYFGVNSFVHEMGYNAEKMELDAGRICTDEIQTVEDLQNRIVYILSAGIELREENAQNRYQNVILTSTRFLQEHFADEDMSLNKVACEVNVSANHFSALFSQEMGQTFIEYLTALRMKKAKELLRCSDKRSGEIALEVGYKDSHYFSFLFRKTQGCTPSEYRNQKETLI